MSAFGQKRTISECELGHVPFSTADHPVVRFRLLRIPPNSLFRVRVTGSFSLESRWLERAGLALLERDSLCRCLRFFGDGSNPSAPVFQIGRPAPPQGLRNTATNEPTASRIQRLTISDGRGQKQLPLHLESVNGHLGTVRGHTRSDGWRRNECASMGVGRGIYLRGSDSFGLSFCR